MKLKILLLFVASVSSVVVVACSEVVLATPAELEKNQQQLEQDEQAQEAFRQGHDRGVNIWKPGQWPS